MNKIQYTTAESQTDLLKILTLQQKNLKKNLTPDQIAQSGYLTI